MTQVPFHVEVVPVTPLQQNCSILRCNATGRAVVVDPGGDVPLIHDALQRLNAKVEAIWLTHGHFDHVGGAAELAEATNAPVIGPHRDDEWLLEAVAEQAAMFGLEGGRAVTPDRWLEEGEAVRFGEVTFQVRHLPGHTPGHVVLVNQPARLALVGDVLFAGSIGRTDFPRSDHAALMAGIRDKLLTLDDDVTFIPGHGPTSTIGEQRRTNPFLAGLA